MDARLVAIDCEGTPEKPWSLQFAVKPGEAFLIRATDSIGLAHFRDWLVYRQPLLLFHNALYDLAVLRAMGIDVIDMGLAFSDSMVMAYLLQVEPQGLKPLCARHCGMKMQSYDEVLGEAGTMLATDYLWSLFDIEELDYAQRRYEAFEASKTAGRRVRVLPKLPRSSLHKAVERCLRSIRPRSLWADQADPILREGTRLLGTMPGPTLSHVGAEEAIRYACRDADGTLRLYHQLMPRLQAMGLV